MQNFHYYEVVWFLNSCSPLETNPSNSTVLSLSFVQLVERNMGKRIGEEVPHLYRAYF